MNWPTVSAGCGGHPVGGDKVSDPKQKDGSATQGGNSAQVCHLSGENINVDEEL